MGISRDTEESDRIVGSSLLLAKGRDIPVFRHHNIRTDVSHPASVTR